MIILKNHRVVHCKCVIVWFVNCISRRAFFKKGQEMGDGRNMELELWEAGGGSAGDGHADDFREGGSGVFPRLRGGHMDSHCV